MVRIAATAGPLLLCAALLGASAPVAAELAIELTTTLPERIVPEMENPPITLAFTMDCTDHLLRQGAPPDSVVTLQVAFETTDHVVITGPPAVFVPECEPPQTEIVAAGNWNVAIKRSAPAFTPIDVVATAMLPPDPTGQTPDTAALTFPVVADFRGLVDVRAPVKLFGIKQAGIHEVPIRLANHGNGAANLTVTVTGGPADWFRGPETILLPCDPCGGDEPTPIETMLRFDVPRGFGGEEHLELIFSGVAADDPSRAVEHDVAVTFLFHDQTNVLNRVLPGPATPLMGVGLLAAAFVTARRRA